MILKIVFVLYLIETLLGLLLILIQTALKKRLDKTRSKNRTQWLLPWYYIIILWFIAFSLWNNYVSIDESGRQIFFILFVGGLLIEIIAGFLNIILYYPVDLIVERPRA